MIYLDLDIEQTLGIDFNTKRLAGVMCETFLVLLLGRSPLGLERRVVGILEQALELVEILEPGRLVAAKGLGDEVTERRVALVKPTTRSDTVGNVAELWK
jgi:hypothetical protein